MRKPDSGESIVPEIDKELLTGEGIDNLNSIDDANACHSLSIVRAQQQSQLDELVPGHA